MAPLPPLQLPRRQPGSPRRSLGRAARWRWTALGAALALALLDYLGALLLLRSAPVQRALRARAVAELATRLPGARLEGSVRVDAALRLVLGPVVLGPPGAASPLLVVDRTTVQPRLGRLMLGHLEAGTVTLRGVHIQAGCRGERLAKYNRLMEIEAELGTRACFANPFAWENRP